MVVSFAITVKTVCTEEHGGGDDSVWTSHQKSARSKLNVTTQNRKNKIRYDAFVFYIHHRMEVTNAYACPDLKGRSSSAAAADGGHTMLMNRQNKQTQ
ncbi:hypothetical protein M514_13622 [Trichuris suis]|uniref:Uncharacterized protein n=1 Tax=Trichuris suis TaxID=68888 RepID=A0A085MSN3_9BILA|nr:hypothetical protein M513_13622 [Trichuris suis]KFD60229.1 hypothetical protein M514_13622 [Trichuris suis]